MILIRVFLHHHIGWMRPLISVLNIEQHVGMGVSSCSSSGWPHLYLWGQEFQMT